MTSGEVNERYSRAVAELDAMRAIVEALKPLDDDERKRVLAAVMILCGLVAPEVVFAAYGGA